MKSILFSLIALPLLVATDGPGGFPDIHRSWHGGPLAVSVSTVRQLVPGMERHQVSRLLGAPHFGTGVASRRWDYVFSLADGGKPLVTPCQLRLSFEHRRLARIEWNHATCAAAVQ